MVSMLLSYVFMVGKEYERCVKFRNHTSVQPFPLEILLVKTEINNNICTEIGYDTDNGCYQFTCVQKHIIYAILTLGMTSWML